MSVLSIRRRLRDTRKRGCSRRGRGLGSCPGQTGIVKLMLLAVQKVFLHVQNFLELGASGLVAWVRFVRQIQLSHLKIKEKKDIVTNA